MGLILVQISAKRQLPGMRHWWLRTQWMGRTKGKQAGAGSQMPQPGGTTAAQPGTSRAPPSTSIAGWLISGSQWPYSASAQLTNLPLGGGPIFGLRLRNAGRDQINCPEMRKLVKVAEDSAIPILGPACKSLCEAERQHHFSLYF